jgi:MoaA/NifB/PqqE/SkfB family radical SAM enzyme
MKYTAKAAPIRPRPWERDFNVNPFIVIWEVTRACQLHCLHCRAEAQRRRHPLELTTAEGLRLIDEIAEMDRPLFVLTGGDPLEREDLFDFIHHGTERGLEVAMTPSATPRVTREALERAKEAGLARCAFSIDGSTPEIHDRFRGSRGSYDLTIHALGLLRELQIPMQVNTTVTRRNLHDLPRIADLIESFGPVLWSVFFLVPTGRARAQDMVSAEEVEEVLAWLWEQSKSRPFDIKATAAPHYRRVVLQQRAAETAAVAGAGRGATDMHAMAADSQAARTAGSPHKCGACEFKMVCGGSRARAFAVTGDYLASDPACADIPPGWSAQASQS